MIAITSQSTCFTETLERFKMTLQLQTRASVSKTTVPKIYEGQGLDILCPIATEPE